MRLRRHFWFIYIGIIVSYVVASNSQLSATVAGKAPPVSVFLKNTV